VLDKNPKDPNAKKKYDLCVAQLSSSQRPASTTVTGSETTQTTSVPQRKVFEPKMVFVRGGTFTMGCTSEQGDDCFDWERPAHSVTLSDYYIGKYEVTQAQWRAVMGNNPSYFKGDNLPVEYVHWDDVQEFITKLNSMTGKQYRLPTEAEWEYAARGGNSSMGYKYSGSNAAGNVAWYEDNSNESTHVVGTKSPNELGIYDMSGNVFEWCSDWYGDYSSSAQTNPQGPSSGSDRVIRGGSWNDGTRAVRVSFRIDIAPSYENFAVGFRLVLSSR
jgi:formylglycine-generating enzyme required for sulfatase activity